ncbi:MAG: MerR family DNA-binding transcriptional regulator [Acidovorax sp.]|nr:MAG: MerR family DNA-binding transcriptional regulator [Acidovorax sp.]
MQISELAQRTAVSVHALRHYERLGLLQPRRRANGYRDYPAALQREVVFIAMSRQLGFSLPQIAERLGAYRAGTLRINTMVEALSERAAALDQQIAALEAQKARVLDHQAWLQAQQAKAKRPPPAAPQGGWPRVRSAGAPAPAVVQEAPASPTPSTPVPRTHRTHPSSRSRKTP